MNVVIVGGGKVGYYLTKTLLEHGHHPTLIEKEKGWAYSLANELDVPIVCGDGTTIEVLASADTANADALISVTDRDEDNLIACQLAKKTFGVEKTVAKVNNPKNTQVLKQLGVDIPISSTNSITHLLEREVDISAIKQIMALNHGDVSINEFELPKNFAYSGKSLSEIDFPTGCIIATLVQNDELVIPQGDTRLYAGDKLVAITKNSQLHQFAEMLGLATKTFKGN